MGDRGLARLRQRIATFARVSVVRASSLRVLALLLGVAASVLLARLGGSEAKGTASAFAATNALAYTLVALDLPQQILRTARERKDLGVVAGLTIRSWSYYILFGSVVTLVYWALGDSREVWLLVGTLGYLASSQLGVAANGVSGPVTAAIGAVLQQSGMAILTIVAYMTTGLDSETAKAVVTGSYLVVLPYFLWSLRRARGRLLGPERLPPREFIAIARLGLRWQPTRAAQMLLLRLDTLVAYAALGAATTGVYSVGLSTAMLAGLVPAQFAANTTHRATIGGRPAMRRDLMGALLSGTASSAVLVATGWFLIPVLYGEDFSEAYWVLVLVAPGVIAYGALQVLTNQLRITGRALFLAIPSFLGVALMSLSLLLTASQWGVKGIAVSSSVGATSALVCAYLILRARAASSR